MKRVNIGTAIAIFGEEPGYRFRRMVGAHHDGNTGDAEYCAFIRSRAFHCREQNRSGFTSASRSACSLARTAPLLLTVSTSVRLE